MFAVPTSDKSGCSDLRIGADVTDVTENVTGRILRPRRSQMRAHPAKDRSRKLLAIICHREAADDFEAKASQELRLELFQMRTEARKRKAFPGDVGDFFAPTKIGFCRALKLRDLAGR